MSDREVHVHVDRVVLEGVPPELHERVVAALTAELGRLAASGALPIAAATRTVDGPAAPTAESVGIAAARGIWGAKPG